MNIKYLVLSISLFLATNAPAQKAVIRNQKVYGGVDEDYLVSSLITADKGVILCGYSKSNISGRKSQNAYNESYDYWIVKLNKKSKVVWDKTFGGIGVDEKPYIIQTKDGGYLIGGRSISPASGNKSEEAINRSFDFWLLKITEDGEIEWENTIGAIEFDAVAGLAECIDGGYLIGGFSYSTESADKTAILRSTNVWCDYWTVKVDLSGNVIGDVAYGAGDLDVLVNIQNDFRNGYILAGYSYSSNDFDKSEKKIGNSDYWIVNIDNVGKRKWDRTLGGKLSEFLTCIIPTKEGGYLCGGYSNSPASANKSENCKGIMDYWIIMIDGRGNKLWDKTLGGTGADYLTSMIQTDDNGFLIGGYSNSNISGNKTENSRGNEDFWILKLDSTGNIEWDKTIGGTNTDKLTGMFETAPGKYLITGNSNSEKGADKSLNTVLESGKNDFWMFQLIAPKLNKIDSEKKENTQFIKSDLSLEKGNNLMLQVSPNPFNKNITVSYSCFNTQSLNLDIYNASGEVVVSKILNDQKGAQIISLSSLPAGIYYVALYSNTDRLVRKIIKQ